MNIARVSVAVSVVNAVGQLMSFALFACVAALYGATWQTDAFFLALTVPTFFIASVVNAVTSVLIPVLANCRVRGGREVDDVVGSAIAYLGVLTTATCILLAIAAPHLTFVLGRSVDHRTGELASRHLLIMLPLIVSQCVVAILAAAYNAAGVFLFPQLAVVARFMSTLVLLFPLKQFGSSALPVAFVLGAVVQLGMLVGGIRKIGLRPRLSLRLTHEFRRFIRSGLPLIAGTAALQFGAVVSRFLAAHLGPGSVSLLDYSYRIASGLMELLTSGILLVILGDWSGIAARGENDLLGSRVRDVVCGVLFLIVPATVILIVLRNEVAVLALRRGQFDNHLAAAAAGVLLFYLVALPVEAIGRTYVRLLLVWQNTGVMALLGGFRVVVTIAFSLALMPFLGVPGLALSELIAAVASTFSIAWVVQKYAPVAIAMRRVEITKIVIASFACGMTASVVRSVMSGLPAFAVAITTTIAATIGYVVAAWLLRIPELMSAYRALLGSKERLPVG